MNAGDLISGKYRLLRLLGTGGMGAVWGARNELTNRDFAIKFLHRKLADNKEALQRFFLEARASGHIKHTAIVDVYDMGQAEDGSPYIVMELLEGEGFDQRLDREDRLRPAEAAAYVAFAARGLAAAHARGVVHRDLKPGNLFLAYDARGTVTPKVLDFGISKAVAAEGTADFVKTTTGAVLGSPAYMSPEQARGDTDVDARTDVWSLGVILYEALTGCVPFDAPNYNALMVAILTRPHVPAADAAEGVPRELSDVVDAALTKDRVQRIGTARELADRLEQIVARLGDAPPLPYGDRAPALNTTPAPTTTQSAWTEPSLPTKRRSATSIAVAVFVAAALVASGVVAYARTRPPPVAVAKRSAGAIAASLARVKAGLDREARAEAEAKASQAQAAPDQATPAAAGVEPPETVPPPPPPVPTGPQAAPNPARESVRAQRINPAPRPSAKPGSKNNSFGVAGPGF